MIESFDFGSESVKSALTGKLSVLSSINGLRIPDEYPFEAMDRLRERYLNIALSDVALPELPEKAKEITFIQKSIADKNSPVTEDQLTAQAWFERGYMYGESNKLDEALNCYTEAIRLEPTFSYAYTNRSDINRQKGHLSDAIADANKAIEIDPQDGFAFNNRGIVFGELGELDKALKDFEECIRLRPNSAPAYSNRGRVLFHKGKIDSALESINKSISLDPNIPDAYYVRAQTHQTVV